MARKAKKSNVPGYLAIIAVICLIGALWLSAQRSKPADDRSEINQNKDTVPIVETKPTEKSADYVMAPLNSDIKKIVAQKLLEISPVSRDTVLSAASQSSSREDAVYQTVNDYSFAFDYLGSRYVVAADYSGGEHCCFNWYAFTLDSRNLLTEVKPDAAISEMGNVYPEGEQNLVKKNGNLYLALADDRFAYYCGSYAGSPLINRYFLISDNRLILKNNDFKDEFLKAAQDSEKELEKYYGDPNAKAPDDADILETKCRLLVQRTADYLAVGEDAKAWDQFDSLYEKLSPMNPYKTPLGRYAAAGEIKADIAGVFKEP
jgi:hypothetical protein